jgi:N-acetylglutamate synthase-like GNAT family acetyltransferase
VSVRIFRRTGKEAGPEVDAFYESEKSNTRARDGDLFFLAYEGAKLLGAVRFCVEENTPMLRGMMIHSAHRKSGIGKALLRDFGEYLRQEKVENTFCLPYAHLENFYEAIGFRKTAEMPAFLRERMKEYNGRNLGVICMRRE